MMTFLARMKVKEDKVDDFVRLAEALTEKVRELEPDTVNYEFFKQVFKGFFNEFRRNTKIVNVKKDNR